VLKETLFFAAKVHLVAGSAWFAQHSGSGAGEQRHDNQRKGREREERACHTGIAGPGPGALRLEGVSGLARRFPGCWWLLPGSPDPIPAGSKPPRFFAGPGPPRAHLCHLCLCLGRISRSAFDTYPE
jgi:hypothetical protein